MLTWTIAAAQYAPRKGDVAENITHHLRFIDAAAEQACKVIIFPELSLTGPDDNQTLPTPPPDSELQPLSDAAQRYQMTIIAGLPVDKNGARIKGIVIFNPDSATPLSTSRDTEPAWRRNPARLACLSLITMAVSSPPRLHCWRPSVRWRSPNSSALPIVYSALPTSTRSPS
ncbi:NAD synthase [Kluyvera cryocrescens]|uniref:NAD synthase n=1 Tax=Kluyvera cryocrescens TaxID=580 RepID=A0A485A3H1_KLUCR|nr:NAD synthase [Kluyvera cryocrescens]